MPEEFSVSKGDQTKIEFVIELDKDVCLETAQNWFNRACTSYECWRSSPCQHGGSTPSIARSSNSSIFSQSSSGKYSIATADFPFIRGVIAGARGVQKENVDCAFDSNDEGRTGLKATDKKLKEKNFNKNSPRKTDGEDEKGKEGEGDEINEIPNQMIPGSMPTALENGCSESIDAVFDTSVFNKNDKGTAVTLVNVTSLFCTLGSTPRSHRYS